MEVLLELSRRGSMRAVADALSTTTSSVSQQIATLAREAGAPLVEPAGRRVRLTPAGRRLAEHATMILAAVEAARHDLDPDAEPAGTVRVAGFVSAIRTAVMPIVAEVAGTPVRIVVREHEPTEARALLAVDEVDLVIGYDYDLAPAPRDPSVEVLPLWSTRWGVGVPVAEAEGVGPTSLDIVAAFAGHDWIGNSRNVADEQVLRTLASMADLDLRVAHEADSLELVEDLVVAGLGVGLLPLDRATGPGVRVLALTDPGVRQRAAALTRRGRAAWPPLALVLRRLQERHRPTGKGHPDSRQR